MQASISLESNADGIGRIQDQIVTRALPSEARDNPVPRTLAPVTTAVVPFVLDGQEPKVYAKDEWVSFLIGRFDYADAFGISHWMKFCLYVANQRGELWNCHAGNDEDTNPEAPPPSQSVTPRPWWHLGLW